MNLTRRVRDKRQLVMTLNGTPSFDPSTTEGGVGFFRWDLGDGTLLDDDATFTHAYVDTNKYTVRADKRYMKHVIALVAASDDLVSVDARGLTRLGSGGGNLHLHNNPNLNSVKLPIQDLGLGDNLAQLRLDGCDILGAIDISGITQMDGLFFANGNQNSTSVVANQILTGGGSLTNVALYSMGSVVTIDISGLHTMRSVIQARNNPSMTTINFPNNIGSSTGAFTSMRFYQNSQLTTLDMSTMENVAGSFWSYACPNLTSIIWPSSPTSALTELRVEQCDLIGDLDVSQFNIDGQIRFHSNSNLTSFSCPSSTILQQVSILWGYSCDLTGDIDLTPITRLRGSIQLRNNPNLTGVTFNPTPHSLNTSLIYINDCDLTGNLDVSMFQVMRDRFRVNGNPNLTSITNPVSSGIFEEYFAFGCGLTGTLDVSMLTGLGGEFEVFSNPNLTSISNPTSTETFDDYLVYSCDLTGLLDLSGLSGGFRVLQGYSNPNLTGITFAPTITSSTNQILTRFNQCDLTGVLDMSSVTTLGGLLWLSDNPNLTSITFPTSTVDFDDARLDNCDLTGTIDVSGMNLQGNFDISNNPNLTNVVNPSNSNTFISYDCGSCTSLGHIDMTPLSGLFDSASCTTSFFDCGMTAAEVNEMLVDFDNNSSGSISGRVLGLTGGNAAPDSISGGFDGLAAKASLILKGYTVNTN